MVGNKKIVISQRVILYLDKLVQNLYQNDYFSFLESAQQYVGNIYDFINKNLQTSRHYDSPENLKHLGSFYIFYKANKRTTWYVFFEKRHNHYLVTTILNNYCKEIKSLNEY